jgi:hypothetical protein
MAAGFFCMYFLPFFLDVENHFAYILVVAIPYTGRL